MATDDQVSKLLFKFVYRQDSPVLTAVVKAGTCVPIPTNWATFLIDVGHVALLKLVSVIE